MGKVTKFSDYSLNGLGIKHLVVLFTIALLLSLAHSSLPMLSSSSTTVQIIN